MPIIGHETPLPKNAELAGIYSEIMKEDEMGIAQF